MWGSWWEEMPQTKEQHSRAPAYHHLVGTRTQAFEIAPRVHHVLATEAEQRKHFRCQVFRPREPFSALGWLLATLGTACHQHYLMTWEVLTVHVHDNGELIIR